MRVCCCGGDDDGGDDDGYGVIASSFGYVVWFVLILVGCPNHPNFIVTGIMLVTL